MGIKISTVTKSLPRHQRETKDIIPFVDLWLSDQEDRFRRKAIKIFENAGVDKRYGIMNIDEVFTATSFKDKNDIYTREVKKLGKDVLEKALNRSGWDPLSLDYIITVSCTGIMIPSLDAYLINELGLQQHITRLPVTEMGCAAGISGIIYAKQFLEANPNKRAAVIAVEAPTATFQHNDYSMVNIVSAAIFGDGAACALLSSYPEDTGVEIISDQMYHFYEATHMMGFQLVNSGLQMVLDKEVPETISDHFPKIIHPFLEKKQFKY